MKQKILLTLLILTMSLTAVFGCFKPNEIPDTEDTLEIYVWTAGYGYKWAEALAADFKTLDWVKEKYPNLEVYVTQNREATYGADRIQAGKNNTIDLIFGQNLFSLFGRTDTNNNPYLAELSDVYESMVPGENVKVKDKMLDTFVFQIEGGYYSVPWAAGMDGILYNENILNSLGVQVPVTTNEFIAVLDLVKSLKGNTQGKYDKGYSVMSSTQTGYWSYMLPIWWAQYEGYQGYVDFYNGVYDNTIDKAIFTQQGRLESLRVMNRIINPNNGYMYQGASSTEFMASQTNFLMGNGIFQVNGDWFNIEMANSIKGLKEKGYDYTIKFMKSPVISAIIDRTPTINDDATLAAVVRAIDAGQTSYPGVSEADFAIVAEARTIVETIGYNHTAVIPEYASAKELAKDFLRYMATDRANKIYIETTQGASLPFKYNVKEKAPELYNSLAPLQKVKYDIYFDPVYPATVLPSPNKFKLVYFGGLSAFNTIYGNIETFLFQAKSNTKAEEIFNTEINYWTDERWQNLIVNAGL